MMEDPEGFLDSLKGKRVVLDEIHRLQNPSELLKIAADHYPTIRILATGSSTLGISGKFKDTLTGRKRELWLTPINLNDLNDFTNTDLRHRFIYGGLPPFFMAETLPEKDFQEWVDAYWAKDIQELFRLEKRYSFQKFFELLMARSGSIFEATGFARACEVSRTSITNYLKALETTFVAHIIRPFTSRRRSEIVSAPKVYGFDTGFICYHRGISSLRNDDLGFLWEHFVLNEIQSNLQTRNICYWRDKRGHEIDFVIRHRGIAPIAIECKWKMNEKYAKERNIASFLQQYPQATIFIVASDIPQTYQMKIDSRPITITSLPNLINKLRLI